VLLLLCFAWVGVVSLREEESGAAKKAMLLSLILPVPYLVVGFTPFSLQNAVCVILILLVIVPVVLFMLPIKGKTLKLDDTPTGQIDERDIMFSRNLLVEGSARYASYYDDNPDKQILDNRFRNKPGLLSEKAKLYNLFSFSAAKASFSVIEHLHPVVEGNTAGRPVVSTPEDNTRFIRQWALQLGAVSIGFTELKDYHYYSHIGRGPQYGEPVETRHRYAVALTVEMDKYMLDRAPLGPTVMETAKRYLLSGAIAVQLAECIRELGYPARAHIDGNYRVVCPLVARDAGLGEIGRMGLLMTPELGPRVRIAVVTTDIPIVPDLRQTDHTVIDFCSHCRKCAEVCPSNAIPFETRQEINGVTRWQINSEACFTLWCVLGTDCGRCMRVCPYSHPDNALHNLIRKGIRHNVLFLRSAVYLDDFFYGRKPEPGALPEWLG